MTIDTSLKFIIDVGVGRSIEEWLKSKIFNILTIGSINPEMKDSQIIQLANIEDGIIITMDKDFGELVFKENNNTQRDIVIKIRSAVGEEKLAAIQNIIPGHLDKLKNNFSVYQNGKLRTREQ
ncbi:MAG: DUF5615 family PIN-like protein [Bacteroidota bacterium]|nr:DUF5615 family PIN-like protein [Bacteroidota bacterium]